MQREGSSRLRQDLVDRLIQEYLLGREIGLREAGHNRLTGGSGLSFGSESQSQQ